MKLDIGCLGEPVRKKGAQAFFNCPFHEDDGGHLGVNTKKGVYHCFKCNASGKLKDLEVPLTDFQNKVKEYLNGKPEELLPPLTLPREFKKINRFSGMPYRYLTKRGLYDWEIKKYGIGFCSEGFFAERVIFPVYEGSILKYFVGRSYTNKQPKYLNSPVPKGGVIFKTFDKRVEKAIVCEGIFDAIQVGKVFPAISLLGKVVNGGEQIHSIVKATKKAYVMLDNDAEKDGFIAANLLNYYIPTQVMFIKQKDPGSMSVEELKKILPK